MQQFLVAAGFLQLFLHQHTGLIDLLQIRQESTGVTVQQLQNKAGALEGPEIADSLLGEVADNRRVTGTNRDDDLITQHDAQRNGGIHIAAAFGLDIGDVNQDQRLLLIGIVVNTGRFFLVQSGREKGRIQVEASRQPFNLFASRIEEMHPGALLQCGAFREMIIDRLEDSFHASSSFHDDGIASARVSAGASSRRNIVTIRVTVHVVSRSFRFIAGQKIDLFLTIS